MDDGIEINLIGFDELAAKMEQLPNKVNRKCMRASLDAGGKVLFAAVETRTPVRTDEWTAGSDSLQPGELKASLQTKLRLAGGGNSTLSVFTVLFRNLGNKDFAYIADWIERGHRLVRGGYSKVIGFGRNAGKTRGPGKEVGQVPAYPFIRPAFDEASQAAIEAFCNTLKTQIETKLCNQNSGAGGDDTPAVGAPRLRDALGRFVSASAFTLDTSEDGD